MNIRIPKQTSIIRINDNRNYPCELSRNIDLSQPPGQNSLGLYYKGWRGTEGSMAENCRSVPKKKSTPGAQKKWDTYCPWSPFIGGWGVNHVSTIWDALNTQTHFGMETLYIVFKQGWQFCWFLSQKNASKGSGSFEVFFDVLFCKFCFFLF